MLSLFCGFPSGSQWKQYASSINPPMLPDAATESQKHEVGRLLVPTPHFSACLQNTQTERASLDSMVCVCASDASPQL